MVNNNDVFFPFMITHVYAYNKVKKALAVNYCIICVSVYLYIFFTFFNFE